MIGVLLSILAGLIPMAGYAWFLYFLDRYEKEPLRLLLGVFSWGAVVAAGTAFFLNSLTSLGVYLLTRSEITTLFTLSTLVAPVVEETLKGLAVMLVFLAFQEDFDSPLDGIVYAGITALGFAASENAWYIYSLGYLPAGVKGLSQMAVIRTVLVGWQHPFYTSFIGLGLALARRSLKPILRWLFPAIGWSMAVFFHLSHNLLATLTRQAGYIGITAVWDWSGYIGLLFFILLLIRREQNWMKAYLQEELDQGLITTGQYQIACSALKQSLVFLHSLFNGSVKEQRRFFQACGDLMHKKRQLVRHGDRQGESAEILRLRSKIASLGGSLTHS